MMKSRIKITNDGTPFGVTVMDADSGYIVPHVRAVRWSAAVNALPTAEVEIAFAEIDAAGKDACFWVGNHRLTLDEWRQVEALIHSFEAAKAQSQ